jgi:hypothetical protein
MGKKVLLDAQLAINSSDVTQWCAKVELEDEFEDKETTTFASGKAKEYLGGLESGSVGISFKNDFAVAALDSIMWALRRSVVTWATRADAGAVTTSNPQYGGSILINKWTPISGSVGDVAEVDVTFPLSGPMTRVTST